MTVQFPATRLLRIQGRYGYLKTTIATTKTNATVTQTTPTKMTTIQTL